MMGISKYSENPVTVISGIDILSQIRKYIPNKKLALVTSKSFKKKRITERIVSCFDQNSIILAPDVLPNPDINTIMDQANFLRKFDIDGLIALGGGSCIDTAKALARIINQPRNWSLRDYLENNKLIDFQSLDIYAIPTTAGTGAEVTPFATIWDFYKGKKYSLNGKDLFPKFAFLDPLLTMDLNESQTMISSLDTLSHGFESIWNNNATLETLSLSYEVVKETIEILPKVLKNPNNLNLRLNMLIASNKAGLAISHTKTALAHSISYPITTKLMIPHGIACSFTLSEILNFNMVKDDGRLETLINMLGFENSKILSKFIFNFLKKLGIKKYINPLIKDDIYKKLVKEMITKDRANNNLREVNFDDIEKILNIVINNFRQ